MDAPPESLFVGNIPLQKHNPVPMEPESIQAIRPEGGHSLPRGWGNHTQEKFGIRWSGEKREKRRVDRHPGPGLIIRDPFPRGIVDDPRAKQEERGKRRGFSD